MVDYTLNPLGGFNLGQGIKQLGQDIERKEEKERLLSERQELQDLSLKAAQGDPDAIESLFAKNPQLGNIFEQRQTKMQQQEAGANQSAFNDWALKYATADQEQKKALEQEALDDPMIDFDESDIAMNQNQKDFAVNAALYQSMGKDAYKQFFGGGDADKGAKTANIQDFEYYQKLKKSNPEAATQFGQDVGLVSKEGRELSPFIQKKLSEYTDEAVRAANEANRFDVLAGEYEKLNPATGIAGSITEGLKAVTGSQDAVSEIKKKYLAIRASQSVRNLPPGPASDKDIALAISGFPPDNAGIEYMASFLRGLSKLERFNQGFNEFKSQYISDNGSERGMLKAWNDSKQANEVEQPKEQVEQQTQIKEAKAPQTAIDYLIQNPNLKDQFKAKYGYLPEGFNG